MANDSSGQPSFRGGIDLPEDDYIIQRLVNQGSAAEGSILPPRQTGEFRIPVVNTLQIAQTQPYFGGVTFTLTWNEPSSLTNVSHYSVYVQGLSGNVQPQGPFNTQRSPANIRLVTSGVTAVTFIVQTVMKNGQVSDFAASPAVSGFSVVPQISASGVAPGTLTPNLLSGAAGQMISFDSTNTGVEFGPGTVNSLVVSNGANTPAFKSIRTMKLAEFDGIISASTTLANSNTETDLFTYTIPANTVASGEVFTFAVRGFFSTNGVTDQLTFRWKIGGTTILTFLTPLGFTFTNSTLSSDYDVTFRTSGVSGTEISFARWQADIAQSAKTETTTSTFDATSNIIVKCTGQWNNTSVNNTVTVAQGFVKIL